MKHALKKGKIEILLPERDGGGLTGEVHTLEYEGQKFLLRRCQSLERAEHYEEMSRRFERYGFLPKYLGRVGRDVFYEFIEGRDLRNTERLDYIREVGRIISLINSHNFEGYYTYQLDIFLGELETGRYNNLGKVAIAREKRDVRFKPGKLISSEWRKRVENKLQELRSNKEIKIVYDCTDPTPPNFRVRKGKVYLVDIDSIKPCYKGMGVSKFFNQWGKTRGKREAFRRGYGNKKMEFYSGEYRDFIDLNFLVKRLWFTYQVGKEGQEITRAKIEEILDR